ncbi:hypothetical protein [Arthrobacter tecti]
MKKLLLQAFRWLGAGLREESLPEARTAPAEATDLSERVRRLNTAQLCRAWRVSFLAVISAKTEQELEQLTQKRRFYLEELERRNPRGFASWLNSNPRASSDPEPYLLDDANGRQGAQ